MYIHDELIAIHNIQIIYRLYIYICTDLQECIPVICSQFLQPTLITLIHPLRAIAKVLSGNRCLPEFFGAISHIDICISMYIYVFVSTNTYAHILNR